MIKYYFTGYLGEAAKRMLYDISIQENITLIDDEIENRYIRFLYYRIQDILGNMNRNKIAKAFFYRFFKIYHQSYSREDINRIVFFNSMFNNGYDLAFIKLLKKKHPELQLIMYIVDPSCVLSEELQNSIIPLFDLVYAVNKADCERFGYIYHPLIYSRVEYKADNNEEVGSDIYYLGSGYDRTEKLHEIYEECQKNGLSADFRVMDEGKDYHKYTDELTYYNKSIPYMENIRMIERTNCMLELMHQGFDNPTQRYLEAVTFNKKLLTNNTKVVDFDYYNPKYMHIFSDIHQIDWNWVKEKTLIDYKYTDDFSPRKFLDCIDKDLTLKRAKESLC